MCHPCQWQENWQLLPMLTPSGFDRAQNLSEQWLILHAQLSQFSLIHNVVCFVSLPPFSWDVGIFKDVELDASQDIPTPSCQSFLFNIFTSFDIPGSSPSIVVLIFQLRLQLVSEQDPLVLLTQRSRLRTPDISNFSGDDRTERVKPCQLRN